MQYNIKQTQNALNTVNGKHKCTIAMLAQMHTLATGRTSGCTHTGNRKDIWPVKKLPLKKPLGLQLM